MSHQAKKINKCALLILSDPLLRFNLGILTYHSICPHASAVSCSVNSPMAVLLRVTKGVICNMSYFSFSSITVNIKPGIRLNTKNIQTPQAFEFIYQILIFFKAAIFKENP